MSANTRDRNATPESTYYYVQGLLKVENSEEESNILEDAVGVCFNYLTQKKMEWGIFLEKLMELFLDLAFQTEKHSKIKEVLKSYRAVTQNQHPDSLKTILEYYRDNKLQQILDEEIPKDSTESIRDMKSVEDDESSSEIIISSFSPDVKSKKEWIRVNLKTVWEGYKTIVDTVRLNHKMEGVYRATLKKIFEFVDLYNRKHEFKGFCDNERKYGLKNILNKRGDKNEAQKNYYIDIEKEEVNTNNIEIRLEQFDLATKLGLWQEAWQTLEDIKEIMKVRKGPVKNQMRCAYFERLALIFKKSNYWHYHSYAFYNYYSVYITKSKLGAAEKMRMADKLILSVLCIPPSTLESNQSKESQQKIASMMISSNKIPEKRELEEMMVSRGVVENASPTVKQLWYFMFLDFDLSSLSKGMELLQTISREQDYKEVIDLLEDILIYKQLISVAEVYQRIKYDSLISIFKPLSKDKIERVLLECHHRKVIDFVLDEKQGIIIFEDQLQETNPYEEFLACFVDIALLHEETRKHEKDFIVKKAIEFTNTAKEYYGTIRPYKIDEYRKKLKKPRQELEERERERQRKIQEEKRHEELMKKQREAEEKKESEEKLKMFIDKKVKISEIISVKQKRVVNLNGKRIENLTDDQIHEIEYQVFEDKLKEVTELVASHKENRNKKRFEKIDYIQRQRRFELQNQILKAIPKEEEEKQNFKKIQEIAKAGHEEKQKLKNQIEKVAPEVKTKINQYYEENRAKYEDGLVKFKLDLTDEFKKKILNKARDLQTSAEAKKKEEEERRRTEEVSRSTQSSSWFGTKKQITSTSAATGGMWKRSDKAAEAQSESTTTSTPVKKDNDWSFKKGPTTGITEASTFAGMKIDDDDKKELKKEKWNMGKVVKPEDKKEEKKEQKKEEGGWFGKKKQTEAITEPVAQTNEVKKEENQNKFVPPTVEEAKGAWGRAKPTTTGSVTSNATAETNSNTNTNTNPGSKREEPELVFKGAAKKDEKKVTKGKGW